MQQEADISSPRRETISGFIVPRQWDEHFRVTEILIACDAERDVQVVNLKAFPTLVTLARKRASVTGTIRKIGTIETIHVESFTPMDAQELG
jgi:hypothetical protein